MSRFRVTETVVYELDAATDEDALAEIVESDDPAPHFVEVSERTVVEVQP
jgi:hypothetical protein